MAIEVTLLGTVAGMPTRERGHSAVAIRHDGEILLFDCGEGTQRQMIHANLSPMKVDRIFITHWHADHFAGLPGFIQSLSLRQRGSPLDVYGPKNTKKYMSEMMQIGHFSSNFEVRAHDITKGSDVLKTKKYVVSAMPTDHSVTALSYKFREATKPGRFDVKKAEKLGLKALEYSKLQAGETVRTPKGVVKPEDVLGPTRPGRIIVYSGDTVYNEKLADFAKGANLLIHEATFSDELAEHAAEVGHSTTKQAAKIAKAAAVERLVLTHISGRYKTTQSLLKEAKEIFQNTQIAEDLMKIEL